MNRVGIEKESGRLARGGLAALGLAGFAIICCAGLPLLFAVVGSLAIGSVLGIGVGVVVLAASTMAIILRARRRSGCDVPGGTVESDRIDR